MRDKPAKDKGLAAYFQQGVTKRSIYGFIIMSLFLVAIFVIFMDNKFIILFFAGFYGSGYDFIVRSLVA
ncbi:hypothetical protein AAAC51_22310 [Priestia megaterium]